MMVEQILQRGDCGEEFKRDFVLYVHYQKVKFRGKRSKDRWFPIAKIGQLIQLNKRINIKRSCSGSKFILREHGIGKTIKQSFVKLELTSKSNWQAWDEKPCARRTFCINSWPSTTPSTTMAIIVEESVESWKNKGTKSGDDGLTNSTTRRLGEEFKRDFVFKEKQGPIVFHSQHRTTDAVE
ncbi:hypothetical protein Cgig2_002768 [Carnegiea gigantea]|uniref:Uncharacterized protein n=1 Tax=Carnegiea gigantea TaxID=171969 RepID=A0A9Q1H0A0_9CARY|nr:hypothetical protein Cgig2_002768 [Carnegiea gigantea]